MSAGFWVWNFCFSWVARSCDVFPWGRGQKPFQTSSTSSQCKWAPCPWIYFHTHIPQPEKVWAPRQSRQLEGSLPSRQEAEKVGKEVPIRGTWPSPEVPLDSQLKLQKNASLLQKSFSSHQRWIQEPGRLYSFPQDMCSTSWRSWAEVIPRAWQSCISFPARQRMRSWHFFPRRTLEKSFWGEVRFHAG